MLENIRENRDLQILDHLGKCVNTKVKIFLQGEFIQNYGGRKKIIGLILEGNADLKKVDIKGNETILEHLSKGDIFSEMFLDDIDDPTTLVATKKTEVLFIDYFYILKDCKVNCHFHTFVVNHIMDMMMKKTVQLNNKIAILSNRTIREKILTYLKSEANGQKKVTIPYSLQQLADYLCIDRSAMMREMKKLIEEKRIKKNGRVFTIYKKH